MIPIYEPPHGQISDIIPAHGWCAVNDGVHTPLVAWALIRSSSDAASLVPFTSLFDEPEGISRDYQDLGATVLETFEPADDLVFMCGSRCKHYRDDYPSRSGNHTLLNWNVIKVIPAPGWCAVSVNEEASVHSPLAAWALIEELQGKPKDRWRGVVGLDGDGYMTGPLVDCKFVRYSECGSSSVTKSHLEWTEVP
ncbi:hypothetical protein [Gaiella occulta]|uniref:hypothetical protein n=1 Tax=Gaiella occulta TaxID=1002870 RepID=UPI0011C0538B|nr:hypothetical protein [Gaiella occulta]